MYAYESNEVYFARLQVRLCAYANVRVNKQSILRPSSSVMSDRADSHSQVSPEIFDWVQSQAVAGPLKGIHRVVYKPLLLSA